MIFSRGGTFCKKFLPEPLFKKLYTQKDDTVGADLMLYNFVSRTARPVFRLFTELYFFI